MEDTSLVRKVLFYILIILTIIFIYILFFPKKSYVLGKLDGELNPIITDTFNQNVNSIFIASNTYFDNNDNKDKDKVTVNELIDNGLLVELKDSNNDLCDAFLSYAQKTENGLLIDLKCPNKQGIVNKLSDDTRGKLLCLYQYKKKLNDNYTAWSDFSDWQKEEVKSDEFTNVETKIESELDGTKIMSNSYEVSIDATVKTKAVCSNGYIVNNGKCKTEVYLNTIDASITYTCPSGYNRSGMNCYSGNSSVSATKQYFCPSSSDALELRLNGNKCDVFRINYSTTTKTEKYYTCPSGYNLSNNKCYKTEYYEEEVEDYKEVTYYRYQKRDALEPKYEMRFSKPNDQELIEQGFIMDKKITCEI